jgi:hypothetical protein
MVSCCVPVFVKNVAGTGLLEPEPVAGIMLAETVKDQLTEVPLTGVRLKVTGKLLVAEHMTWPGGEAEMVATGLTWTG